jgi:hydroxymethylpyrimidine pyrophosphatase-like HAD family hydrolase
MRVRDDIAARFGERVFCHSIRSPRSHLEVLELFDPAVNKWEGILYVARQHDITSEQVVAIGDDLNDLHMIRNAGLGVAMGNAHPDVQVVADVIIGGNHEEVLAVFLDELVDEHLVQPLAEPAPNQMRRNGTDG